MKIIFNGAEKEFEKEMSLAELMDLLGINRETAAAEVNGKLIKKSGYKDLLVKSGDKVEILRFVGGG